MFLMRDEEGRKKEASKVKQTRQSNIAHPRQSRKNELPRVGLEPTTLYTLETEHSTRRKKERSKQGQTNKAKQHSTPKAVTFPRKNELPRVGTHDTLYSRQSTLPAELRTKAAQLAGPKSCICMVL